MMRTEKVQAQLRLMLNIQPLCTGAKLILGHGVLGELENNSFIALPGKGGHSGLLPLKTALPTREDLVRSFYVWFKGRVADEIRVCAGPTLL